MTDLRDIRSADAPAEKKPTRPELSRIFVGLKMAPEIAGHLALLAQRIEDVPLRLVPTDDIHLTLVPPWNEASIPDAVEKLSQAVEGFGRFSLSFERLCYGPRARRPRLLWVECAPSPEVEALQTALMAAYGQVNDRPFRPHVTLARIERNASAKARRNPVDQRLCLEQCVDAVQLFQSPPPGKRGYRVVASLPLAERPPSAA